MFCAVMNLPPPVARKYKARELLKRLENELGEDGVYNVAVSHDASLQKRGFTSLYGAAFVLALRANWTSFGLRIYE